MFLYLQNKKMANIENLNSFDPFADAAKGDDEAVQDGLVHVRLIFGSILFCTFRTPPPPPSIFVHIHFPFFSANQTILIFHLSNYLSRLLKSIAYSLHYGTKVFFTFYYQQKKSWFFLDVADDFKLWRKFLIFVKNF